MRKNAKGITLIALVITIIVLLILAAISIAALSGKNGILTNAQKSRRETAMAETKEKINLTLNSLKTEIFAQQVNDKRYSGLETTTKIRSEVKTVIQNDLGYTADDEPKTWGDLTNEGANQYKTIKADSNGWHVYLDGGAVTTATGTNNTGNGLHGTLTIAYKDTSNDYVAYGRIYLSNITTEVALTPATSAQLTTD